MRHVGRRTPFIITAFGLGALAYAQSTEKFENAFRAMKRDDKLQFELPNPPEIPKIERSSNTPSSSSSGSGFGDFLEALGPIFQVIFWGGVAAIAVLILYHIAQVVIDTRFERKPKEVVEEAPPPLYTPDQEQARILLDEVDVLASQGRFQEAVHELLFRSIQDIDIHRPNTIRRSLTSREIASLAILTPVTREAFAIIASVVETSYFGGQEIGREEFDKCRAAYAQFAETSAWKAAA